MSELLIDFLLMRGNNFSGQVALKTFLNYTLKDNSALLRRKKGTTQDNKAIIDLILELRKEPIIS
jgi:hypothetical protein